VHRAIVWVLACMVPHVVEFTRLGLVATVPRLASLIVQGRENRLARPLSRRGLVGKGRPDANLRPSAPAENHPVTAGPVFCIRNSILNFLYIPRLVPDLDRGSHILFYLSRVLQPLERYTTRFLT
jgi:hypothetical protein